MKTILITLAACFIASAGYSQNSTNPCSGLVADFTAQADLPVGGVHFTDASQAIGNTPFTSHWDFGNDQTSTEKNPFSLYDEGVYQVTLTITDQNGCVSTVQKDVEFSYNGQ